MINIEGLTTPYEFEDHANFFIVEAKKVQGDFSDLSIVTENQTAKNIESGDWVIKKFLNINNEESANKVLTDNQTYDIDSANCTIVEMTIEGRKKERIREFVGISDKIAKNFDGNRMDYVISDFGESDSGRHQYYSKIHYRFD